MIKPFEILDTRQNPNGSTGVLYHVWRVESVGPGRTKEFGCQSYLEVPAGRDLELYVHEKLSEAGWF